MDVSVSIIIPAWNEEKIIERTYIFLKNLKLPFKFCEIIFVAGGVDKTYEICKQFIFENFNKVLVLEQKIKDHKSGALIKGIRNAKGNIITIIDADTLVAPNFMIEVAKSLKKYDAVNCNYFPMLKRGFWYDFFLIRKFIWAYNPDNLSSLFGAATISLNRCVVEEIGIENFFTNRSTAGVDHYMGVVLQMNKKKIGLVRNSRVITPRPSNLKDFKVDQYRWFTAFFQIHQEDKRIIFTTLIISFLSLNPFIILLDNFKKIKNITVNKKSKIKFYFILFFTEYVINLIRFRAIIERLSRRMKNLGHFKGSRY